jgi:hypothetical protein
MKTGVDWLLKRCVVWIKHSSSSEHGYLLAYTTLPTAQRAEEPAKLAAQLAPWAVKQAALLAPWH